MELFEDLKKHLSVPKSIINKWQRLIDAVAKLMEVSSALIMKYEDPYLEAFITSQNEDNPINFDYREKVFGTYCEYTIEKKEMHEVINAFKDPKWKDKPGLQENKLMAYLGFPLEWPTGDLFGTICVLDKKERHFTEEQKDLLRAMKVTVDSHLELIFKNELLKSAQEKIREQRNNLMLLTSTVRHEIANNLTFIKGFLDLKKMNSELPKEFEEKLLPEVKRSLESIEHIKKLEELFTKEKAFREMNPKEILKKLKENSTEIINVKGFCTVMADEFLDLLLKELIRNAFKHTDTPKVDIILREDKTSATIEVQDYGPTLPESVIQSYFQDSKKSRELKGLTIVQKIMKRYGGEIKYEKNQKGALFKLIWPKGDQR
jgi:c-di-GMP phosphodiesterase